MKWLLYKLTFQSFGQFPIFSGIFPLRKLWERSRFDNAVQFENKEGGISPWNLLSLRLRIVRFDKKDKDSGIRPSKLLKSKRRFLKWRKEEIPSGIFPYKLFPERFKVRRAVRFEMEGENGPTSSYPTSLILLTRWPFLQLIPLNLQTSVVSFQFERTECGSIFILFLNSRSESLSVLSECWGLTKATNTKNTNNTKKRKKEEIFLWKVILETSNSLKALVHLI